MTIITRTVNTIIEGAYKLIGVFSEDRALEGGRVTEGLGLLQEILDGYAAVDTRIAWDSTLTFNLVIGQREYTFSKAGTADVNSNRIVELKYITLQDGDILYPVNIQPDEIYFNRTISLTNSFRPENAYYQNALDTSNDVEESKIVFFSLPDKTYPCTIKAKFVLDAVELNQPLDEVPSYYHRFLKYALGRSLNDHYPGSTWDVKKENEYKFLLENITNASDVNLESRAGVTFKSPTVGYSYSRLLSGH
jgi:hypothetical protein